MIVFNIEFKVLFGLTGIMPTVIK